jgi:hypothetical protein
MIIDPGHPFSQPYADLIDSLEDQIRLGVEQPAETSFVYQSNTRSYPLPRSASDVLRVTGMNDSNFTVFAPRRDYNFRNNQIIWVDEPENPAGIPLDDRPNFPDSNSRFEVEYTFRERPTGLNDLNPGSVIGTLIRAFSREIKLLYEQMDEAYRRAFIDVATGVALDNVVALLGVTRNPETKARGIVTFRRQRTDRSLVIPLNTQVADTRGYIFVTTEQVTFAEGAANVDAPIEALEPGPNSNAERETITVMPTPPPGVTGVTNNERVIGGQDPETDELLRERAKNALARAGNATLTAIEFAVRELDEVREVQVLDRSKDETIPLGEVRVRYVGSNATGVQQVVDRTRAAGVLARLESVETILVSGTFYAIASPNGTPGAIDSFLVAVRNTLSSLNIGESFSVRRLNSLAFNADLADIAEAQLYHDRQGVCNPFSEPLDPGCTPVPEPFLVESTELVQSDEENLRVKLLTGLQVSAIRTGENTVEIDLQLLDDTASAVTFNNYSLDLGVNFRASLRNAPTQPPERIGSITPTLQFTNSSIATLTITAEDVSNFDPGFDPERHNPEVTVTINASLYPSLTPVQTAIDLSTVIST